MKIYGQILLFLLGIIVIISCFGFQKDKSKEAKIQALIDSKVAEKVETYRIKRWAKCRERVLKRAGVLADSIIMAKAKSTTIIDNTARPTPPDRPTRPPIKLPADTTPVAPFFPIDTTE
jgi:hypothetical protein